jgi:hypothetical protein
MKNKDDLQFYSDLLENINSEIFLYYNDMKDRKLKNILDKCGFKGENSENKLQIGNRGYSLDANIKAFYTYIN